MTTSRLYRFSVPPFFGVGGSATTYTYTSSARAVSYSGQTYTPEEVDHSTIEVDGVDVSAGALAFTAPFDLEIVQILALRPPSQPVEIIVYEVDEEAPSNAPLTIFRGEVNSWKREGQAASLECYNSLAGLNAQVPRGRYSSMCRWQLFGEGCRLHASDY